MEAVLTFCGAHGATQNVDTFNILIDYYCQQEMLERASALFEEMATHNITPDTQSFSLMISGYKNSSEPDIQAGLTLFKTYLHTHSTKSIQIYNSLLDLLSSTNHLDQADKIFQKIIQDPDVEPNESTFNILIQGSCLSNSLPHAL